ncbi:MAG: MFS transporter [Sphingomonas sp.]
MSERTEFSRGWKALTAGFLGTMCGASPLPFNVLGFLFEPLNAEFGWNKQQVSIGITIFGVVAALLAPVYGWLSDRFGVRPVALFSLAGFAFSFAALGLTPASLTGFYLLWLVVGMIGIGSTPVTWSRAISMWFVKSRGLALGLMLIGTSFAAILVPKIAVWAIHDYGWRAMFPIVSLLPLLVALPAGLLFFREPRGAERPATLTSADGSIAGMTFGQAVRTRQFWLLWLSILLVAAVYGGVFIHMPAIMKDHGYDAAVAASVMGMVGIGLLAGRVGVGYLLDRVWGPIVAFPVLCLPALACYLLMGTGSTAGLLVFAAFLLGFAGGAESDIIAYFAARYFGMAHFGRIYGMLYMPFGIFSAISPVLYGIVRDKTGSYDPILIAASVIFVIGGGLLLLLGRYPEPKDLN